MSRLLSKTLFSILVLIVGVPFAFCAVLLLYNSSSWLNYRHTLPAADVTTGACLVAFWLWTWHSEVRWTRGRRLLTFVSIFAALVPALLVYWLCATTGHRADGAILAGICWAGVWTGTTTIIWRETRLEQAQPTRGSAEFRLLCPSCGYNLAGLHEARCPECGARYALYQLLASLIKEDSLASATGADGGG